MRTMSAIRIIVFLLTVLSVQLTFAGDTDPVIARIPSEDCAKGINGKLFNPTPDTQIAHQYMLLLIFKKDTGAKYFGNPKFNQYGCVPDVAVVTGPDGQNKYIRSGTQMLTSVCPNDCAFPRALHATNKGNDPLDATPWGILSPADPTKSGGDADSKIEIWQLVAKDACHARYLHYFLTSTATNNPLYLAVRNGKLIGDIMAGYLDPTHTPGSTKECQH